jgi:hypothetical protein
LFPIGLGENNFLSTPIILFGADCSFECLLNIVGQICAPDQRNIDAYKAFGLDNAPY